MAIDRAAVPLACGKVGEVIYRKRVTRQAVWTTIVVAIGVLSGVCLAAPQWTSPIVPYVAAGGAVVGLGVAAIVAHLRVHPWWGLVAAWGGFIVGMVPPLSNDDALWLIAAVLLALIAAGYLALVTLAVTAVRARQARRR